MRLLPKTMFSKRCLGKERIMLLALENEKHLEVMRTSLTALLLLSVLLAVQPAAAQLPRQESASFESGHSFSNSTAVAPSKRSVVLKSSRESRASVHSSAVLARLRLSARSDSSSVDVVAPVMLGVLGGAVGLVAGGLAGGAIETAGGCEDDFLCGLGGTVIGGLAGEALGLSLGVHLGNGRQGNYWLTLLGATGAELAGLALVGSLEADGAAVLIGVPVLQLSMAIPIAHYSE